MSTPLPSPDSAMCSFCGKSHAEVKKLVAGPGVYICDSCIAVCHKILQKELYKTAPKERSEPSQLVFLVSADEAETSLALLQKMRTENVISEKEFVALSRRLLSSIPKVENPAQAPISDAAKTKGARRNPAQIKP